MGDENRDEGQQSGGPDKEPSLYNRPGAAPSPARMFEVAAGHSKWTPAEKAWLAMNPRWIQHELTMRQILKEMGEDQTRPEQDRNQEEPGKGFVNRLKPKEGDKEQEPEGPAP